MNNPALSSARPIFAAFFLLFVCIGAFAQKLATWKGGTPGKPADWHCPSNWKEGRVPNEFSRVIISDNSTGSLHDPILASGEVEVWSIQILSGASLHISKGAHLTAMEQEEHGVQAWSEGILRRGTSPETVVFASK